MEDRPLDELEPGRALRLLLHSLSQLLEGKEGQIKNPHHVQPCEVVIIISL